MTMHSITRGVSAPPRVGIGTLCWRVFYGVVFLLLFIPSSALGSVRSDRFPLKEDQSRSGGGRGGGGAPTIVSPDTASKCIWLDVYMDCTNLKLNTVPTIPEWITIIDLSANELTDDVNLSIGNSSRLNELTLSKNRLAKFPVFRGLDELTVLHLAHNQIQVISQESLLALPRLSTLDLSKNLIKLVLPNYFPSTNVLVNLNLNSNNIHQLEGNSFSALRHLVDLKLAQNQLTDIPLGLFRGLKKLKRLDLSGNRLSEVPFKTFSNVSRLRVLKLNGNNLRNLTTGAFHGLDNLLTLELDSNRLTGIQKNGFFNLTTLQSISFANNSIANIEPNAWEFCQRLVNVDLSHNRLASLNAGTFDCLQRLKTLNLKDNAITMIADGAFNCTTNLNVLDLSENHISYTIEDMNGPFRALRRLTRLHLIHNRIKSINRNAFAGLANLDLLDLTQNNITSIQSDTFAALPALTKLLLNTTSLLCDCNLLGFYEWLTTSRPHGSTDVQCGYPSSIRGHRLLSLAADTFTCNETPKPRIIEELPAEQLAIIDQNLTLTCSATSSSSASPMSFKWKRDQVELGAEHVHTEVTRQPHSNYTIATSRLTFQHVGKDQVGEYQCVVSNGFGSTYSQKCEITVASLPKFQLVPSSLTLNSTSTARLDCAAYGDPKPVITWQKDEGTDFPAATERRMSVMPDDIAFFIINAKIVDQGVYTCSAQNVAGVIKASATLTVLELPTFVKPMDSKEVVTGKSSVVECLASGSPKPKLSWFKDGQPIVITERHFFAAEDQLLIIVDTVAADAGTYSCTIANELGERSGMMQLKVTPALVATVMHVDEMTGIVIITVVCCAVGTSIIWVFIIYQTRKGRGCTNYASNAAANAEQPAAAVAPYHNRTLSAVHGGSLLNGTLVNQSSAAAAKNGGLYESQSLLANAGGGGGVSHHHAPMILPMNQRTRTPDYNYDDFSCKDSGTGDSTKRSSHRDAPHIGTSDMDLDCVEVDKTSGTVSFSQSTPPTVTPCSDDGDAVRFVRHMGEARADATSIASSLNRCCSVDSATVVNIQANQLNELLDDEGVDMPRHLADTGTAHNNTRHHHNSTSSSLNCSNHRLSSSISIVPSTFTEQTASA